MRAIAKEWWDDDQDLRCSFACMLEDIHTDLCVAKCRKFLANEDDPEVELILANALLGNFDTEAVELLWPLVDGMAEDELMPDQRDFRYRLVAIATIMDQTFPKFREWRKAALRDNWGKFQVEHGRVADSFRPDLPGPKWSMN